MSQDYSFLEANFYSSMIKFGGQKEVYSKLISTYNFDIKDGAKILDLGCGDLMQAISFVKEYVIKRNMDIQIYACDLSKEMLVKAQKNVVKSGFEKYIHLFQADVKNLDKVYSLDSKRVVRFKDNSIDMVLGFGIFEYIDDIKKASSEINRVLKNNGSLVLSYANNTIWGKIAGFFWGFDEKKQIFDKFRNYKFKVIGKSDYDVNNVLFGIFNSYRKFYHGKKN